ncbi:MAG: methionyl-tRNA formyltransferase [Eubacterium sp.]|nr:methionyl-tRNA formyltransferase [Eubacterium sp.]
MNIIFMGTPDFAVPCLQKLINSRHNVTAVFSQPDKPVGRKQILTPPPVKACAVANSIPVYQPNSLKTEEALNLINNLEADIIIVVAYGKILPKAILDSKKYGSINVHASLLPKYRGSAPIQWSVINGDEKTGVTIMQMDEGVDTGDMLLVKECNIGGNETSEELFDRLSLIGADALIEAIDMIESNSVNRVKQDNNMSSHAPKITKDLGIIDWSKSADEIHNLVRGLQSWPCAVTTLNGKQLKIHKTVKSTKTGDKCGKVTDNINVLTVCCGDGKCLDITELQLEGKKRMDAKAFLQGNSIELGTTLGE